MCAWFCTWRENERECVYCIPVTSLCWLALCINFLLLAYLQIPLHFPSPKEILHMCIANLEADFVKCLRMSYAEVFQESIQEVRYNSVGVFSETMKEFHREHCDFLRVWGHYDYRNADWQFGTSKLSLVLSALWTIKKTLRLFWSGTVSWNPYWFSVFAMMSFCTSQLCT